MSASISGTFNIKPISDLTPATSVAATDELIINQPVPGQEQAATNKATVQQVIAAANIVLNSTAPNPVTATTVVADYLMLRAYGFVGDGVTDDAPAIQALINATGASNLSIMVPPGHSHLGTGITSTGNRNISLIGQGSALSVWTFAAGVQVGWNHGQGTESNGAFSAKGISFLPTSTVTGTVGLRCSRDPTATNNEAAFSLLLDDVGFGVHSAGVWSVSIDMYGCTDAIISNTNIVSPPWNLDPNGTSIRYQGAENGNGTTVQLQISNVNTQDGVYGVWIGSKVQGINIVNSNLTGPNYGCYWPANPGDGSGALQVSNSQINSSMRNIYVANADNVMLSNNFFLQNDQFVVGNNWAGVECINSASPQIVGNTFENPGGTVLSNVPAIYLHGPGGGGPGLISDNTFQTYNSSAVGLNDAVRYVRVTGNNFHNNPPSNTVTVTQVDPAAWVASTVYPARSLVSANGYTFYSAAGGTSGTTSPTHTSANDGGITWSVVAPTLAVAPNEVWGNSNYLTFDFQTKGAEVKIGQANSSVILPSDVEIGDATTSLAFLDFHSSTSNNDYDARIYATGGTSGTNGLGSLTINAAGLETGGPISIQGQPVTTQAMLISNGAYVSPSYYGAIGGNVARPLSGVTSIVRGNQTINTAGYTLAQWQALYPAATALTNGLDRLALQQAITANAGLNTVIVQMGLAIVIDASIIIPSNTTLIIDGLITLGNGANCHMIFIDNASNVSISGSGTLDGNMANNVGGTTDPANFGAGGIVTAQPAYPTIGSANIRISDINIQHVFNWPISLNSATNCIVTGVTMQNSGNAPQFCAGTNNSIASNNTIFNIPDYAWACYEGCSFCTIDGNVCTNVGSLGVLNDGAPTGWQNIAQHDIVISNNVLNNVTDVGITAASVVTSGATLLYNIIIRGNTINNSGGTGIALTWCTDSIVDGNIICGGGQGNTSWYGIACIGYGHVITNNIIRDGGSTGAAGIPAAAISLTNLSNSLISNNYIFDSGSTMQNGFAGIVSANAGLRIMNNMIGNMSGPLFNAATVLDSSSIFVGQNTLNDVYTHFNHIIAADGGINANGIVNVTGSLNAEGSIEIGSLTAAQTAYADFHSSGVANDYDVRIAATGGSGTVGTSGQGNLAISAASISLAAPVTASSTITATGEIIGENQNAFVAYNANCSAIFRNDGGNFYILKTPIGSPSATFDNTRPFIINFTTGLVSMVNGVSIGDGLTVAGGLTVTSGLSLDNLSLNGTIQFPATAANKINLFSTTYGLGVNAADFSLFSAGDWSFRTSSVGGPVVASISSAGLVKPLASTVAAITALTGSTAGQQAFATNGLKTGETTGAGTGVPCFYDGTHWYSVMGGVLAA